MPISSNAIDNGLRALVVTCGGTLLPDPSLSWWKYELIWRARRDASVTSVNFESTRSRRSSMRAPATTSTR